MTAKRVFEEVWLPTLTNDPLTLATPLTMIDFLLMPTQENRQ
jgi:hypothetical protein